MVERKLYRSESQRMVSGVCGGLAEYFDMDVSLVRLIWIAISLVFGSGLLLYILACLIIPTESVIYMK